MAPIREATKKKAYNLCLYSSKRKKQSNGDRNKESGDRDDAYNEHNSFSTEALVASLSQASSQGVEHASIQRRGRAREIRSSVSSDDDLAHELNEQSAIPQSGILLEERQKNTPEFEPTQNNGQTHHALDAQRCNALAETLGENHHTNGGSILSSVRANTDLLAERIDNPDECNTSNRDDYNTPEMRERIDDCAILDGTFFKVCGKIIDPERVPVQCQSCDDRRILTGSFSVSTNLVKHLRNFHRLDYERYLHHKKTKAKEKRKRKLLTDSKNAPRVKRLRSGINPDNFKERILTFIIGTMSPLAIADHPDFRGLFANMDVQPESRKSVTKRLGDRDAKRISTTKELLASTEYVCTTTDIWSAKRRSFIGVTCHFIDEDFHRQSLPLACKRFTGTHSYDRIAAILDDVHSDYGLKSEKIVATVTDNARNFVKAFQEFGVQLNASMIRQSDNHDDGLVEISSGSDDSEEDYSSCDIESVPIQPSLPRHLRCSSHTLNLVATTDIMNAIKDENRLHRRHKKIIAKCSLIWHKAALPKSAEIIMDTIGHTFSYPIVTRWNSLYDAMKQIFKEADTLPLLFERLGIEECFTAGELAYIDEYCQVMAPIAQAIDILQGEDNLFYGVLLPTLITLRRRIQKLADSNMKCGKKLAEACLDGLERRFENIFLSEDDNRSLLATVAHPAFKLKWLEKANVSLKLKMDLGKVRDDFIREGASHDPEIMPNCSQQSVNSVSSFFKLDALQCSDIESEGNSQNFENNNVVQVQLLSYLSDKRTQFSMLNDYPIARRLFFKLNTPLPSSAPVERLFSFASIVNAPKRHALKDKKFERLVLLKAFSKTGRKLD